MPADYFKNARVKPTWQEMTRQAQAEEARRQAPMGWEVPVDQLYAPSSDVPISGGFAPGGAEYDPTPEMIASMVPWGAVAKAGMAGVRELAESAPRILGNEVGAIGPGVKDLIAKNIHKRINKRAGVEGILNSQDKKEAAGRLLMEYADTGQLDAKGSLEKYIGKSIDDFMDDVALGNLSQKQLEDGIKHNYQGGLTQFLKDYRNKYGPEMYQEYLSNYYRAQTPEGQARWGDIVKTLEKELKSSGVHLDTALERLLIK